MQSVLKLPFFQILKKEFEFTATFESEKTNENEICYSVKCPVVTCKKNFSVFYKGYRSYYKSKKQNSRKERVTAPKWHLAGLQKHLISCHGQIKTTGRVLRTRSTGRQVSSHQK